MLKNRGIIRGEIQLFVEWLLVNWEGKERECWNSEMMVGGKEKGEKNSGRFRGSHSSGFRIKIDERTIKRHAVS